MFEAKVSGEWCTPCLADWTPRLLVALSRGCSLHHIDVIVGECRPEKVCKLTRPAIARFPTFLAWFPGRQGCAKYAQVVLNEILASVIEVAVAAVPGMYEPKRVIKTADVFERGVDRTLIISGSGMLILNNRLLNSFLQQRVILADFWEYSRRDG